MGSLWIKSGTIERDGNDKRARGALAYFFAGGTTTPLTVYKDAGAATPHEHPLAADGTGRWPAVFIPFVASYDVKVTTSGGTQLYYYTEIPNPDPVQAAENTVDPNQLLQTGDWIFTPKTGTREGFVRANGRTIGSATSGASERANADTEDLYAFHWNNFEDEILPVTGGRGASAAADYAAGKPMALFDCRSGHPMGVDDMGNIAAGRAGAIPYTNGNSVTGGSHCGEVAHALALGELTAHTHGINITTSGDGNHVHSFTTDIQNADHSHFFSGTTSGQSASHTHQYGLNIGVSGGGGAGQLLYPGAGETTSAASNDHTHDYSGNTGGMSANHAHNGTTNAGGSHTHAVVGTSASVGSGNGHNNVSYGVSGNFLIKL